jgi:hypothetical protein
MQTDPYSDLIFFLYLFYLLSHYFKQLVLFLSYRAPLGIDSPMAGLTPLKL